jgi:hypothetical protein
MARWLDVGARHRRKGYCLLRSKGPCTSGAQKLSGKPTVQGQLETGNRPVVSTLSCSNTSGGRQSRSFAKAMNRRSRLTQAVSAAFVICVGVASRSRFVGLPPFWAKYSADALWALLVFIGLGLLFPSQQTWKLAALAFGIAGLDEFSQLYHAAWIDAVRRTWLGHAILGDVFAWPDLVAYAIGITVGALAEWAARKARVKIAKPDPR